jgi:predicted RNase H-like nuclease
MQTNRAKRPKMQKSHPEVAFLLLHGFDYKPAVP